MSAAKQKAQPSCQSRDPDGHTISRASKACFCCHGQPVYVFAGCHEACKKTAGFTPPTKPSRAPSYTHTRLLILAFFRLCKSSGPCSKEQTAPETILIGQFLPKNKAVSHKILHKAKNAKFSVSHKPLTSKVEKMLGSAKVKSACVRMGQLFLMRRLL